MPNHLIIDLNQTISKKLIKHRISISGFRLDNVFHCLGIRKPNCFIRFSFKATTLSCLISKQGHILHDFL